MWQTDTLLSKYLCSRNICSSTVRGKGGAAAVADKSYLFYLFTYIFNNSHFSCCWMCVCVCVCQCPPPINTVVQRRWPCGVSGENYLNSLLIAEQRCFLWVRVRAMYALMFGGKLHTYICMCISIWIYVCESKKKTKQNKKIAKFE